MKVRMDDPDTWRLPLDPPEELDGYETGQRAWIYLASRNCLFTNRHKDFLFHYCMILDQIDKRAIEKGNLEPGNDRVQILEQKIDDLIHLAGVVADEIRDLIRADIEENPSLIEGLDFGGSDEPND